MEAHGLLLSSRPPPLLFKQHQAYSHPGPLHLLFYLDCSALRSWQDTFVRALLRCHLLWVLRSLEHRPPHTAQPTALHPGTPWGMYHWLCGAASAGNSGKSCLAVMREKPGPLSFGSCCHLPAFFCLTCEILAPKCSPEH